MKEISLQELREIQLNILLEVHNFCEERNLRYSLGGGTLLGAVRHKGYIPWDDDIDIMMPRPDYERFIKEFVGYRPHLICGCFENDKNWVFPFTKLSDNRTLIEENGTIRESGIDIDIFPIDGLPSSSKDLDKHILKIEFLKRAISYNKEPFRIHNSLLKKALAFIAKMTNIVVMQERFLNLVKKYNFDNANFAGAVTGLYGKKEVYKKSLFDSYSKLDFEGFYFSVVKDYDYYLTQHYGDYMQLPPIEKQVTHHNYKAWYKNER